MTACPCSSGKAFALCCGPLLEGAPAATAEALMRSRYTAFVRGDFAHLTRSHAPETRDRFDRAAAAREKGSIRWLGLTIEETVAGGPGDDRGTVAFAARFTQAGQAQTLRERSRFRREGESWLYVDGEPSAVPDPAPAQVGQAPAAKVGRNDPCPCGSGRKYKKCCGV